MFGVDDTSEMEPIKAFWCRMCDKPAPHEFRVPLEIFNNSATDDYSWVEYVCPRCYISFRDDYEVFKDIDNISLEEED